MMNSNTILFSFTYGDFMLTLTILASFWIFFIGYIINEQVYTWSRTGWRNVGKVGWILFFTPIPVWFILWEYLPYFYITHIVIEVGIFLLFFWYVYSYALYVWRPFWKFEVWRRFRNNPNKRQQALRDLNHSLKYALMKVYIFWSWNGYDRNRHLLPQENEQ